MFILKNLLKHDENSDGDRWGGGTCCRAGSSPPLRPQPILLGNPLWAGWENRAPLLSAPNHGCITTSYREGQGAGIPHPLQLQSKNSWWVWLERWQLISCIQTPGIGHVLCPQQGNNMGLNHSRSVWLLPGESSWRTRIRLLPSSSAWSNGSENVPGS